MKYLALVYLSKALPAYALARRFRLRRSWAPNKLVSVFDHVSRDQSVAEANQRWTAAAVLAPLRSGSKTSPEQYRERAALIRRHVETLNNADVRRQLLKIAEKYEQLADGIERPRRR